MRAQDVSERKGEEKEKEEERNRAEAEPARQADKLSS